jgi:hypothetical protein
MLGSGRQVNSDGRFARTAFLVSHNDSFIFFFFKEKIYECPILPYPPPLAIDDLP